MTGLDFLVLVLATQRLTTLWFEELMLPVRMRVFTLAGRFAYLSSCRMCISVWAAAVVLGFWQVEILRPILWVLALSSGMLLLETVASGFSHR